MFRAQPPNSSVPTLRSCRISMMNEWNELLSHLAELPRENGTPALQQTGSYLAEAFRTAGIETQHFHFNAHPLETRLLGVFVFLSCLVYSYLMWNRRFLAAEFCRSRCLCSQFLTWSLACPSSVAFAHSARTISWLTFPHALPSSASFSLLISTRRPISSTTWSARPLPRLLFR